MLKSKIRQLKKKEPKKSKAPLDVESLNSSAAPSPKEVVLSPPDSTENKEEGAAVDTNQEEQAVTDGGKKKRKVPKKKENGKEEADKVRWSFSIFPLKDISNFKPVNWGRQIFAYFVRKKHWFLCLVHVPARALFPFDIFVWRPLRNSHVQQYEV